MSEWELRNQLPSCFLDYFHVLYTMIYDDPWDAVTEFEKELAKYGGSQYAVCVDSCSNALFLCMKYLDVKDTVIELPARTYASVPMQCIHAGNSIKFVNRVWSGCYRLFPTPIFDSACRFHRGMYVQDSYFCLSFHHRKTLNIGKGGAILTNDYEFVEWARTMIYDGRHKYTKYDDDTLACIGYHMYMTPEDADCGREILYELSDTNPDTGDYTTYNDLREQTVFNDYIK